MTIRAQYQTICPRCSSPIQIGDTVSWQRGSRATHVACVRRAPTARPPSPIAIVAGGAKVPTARNRRPDQCDHCGTYLRAGEGTLVRCIEDSGCPEHHDTSGWHVYCADTAACRTQVEDARQRRRTATAQRQAWHAAVAAIVDPIPPAEIPVDGLVRRVTGCDPEMPHTASRPVLTLTASHAYYYVPGYFACDMDHAPISRCVELTDETRAIILRGIEAAQTLGIVTEERNV